MTLRTIKTRTPFSVSALALPNRLVPTLGSIALILAVLYVALMITTIFFAAWQTQLAHNIDEKRVAIEQLETRYYAAIARIDAADPSSFGLGTPEHVEYVVAARMPGLTFADR